MSRPVNTEERGWKKSGEPAAVVLLHPWSDLYGSGYYLFELTLRLKAGSYRPVVALPEEGPLSEALRRHNIKTVIMEMGRFNKKDSISGMLLYFLSLFRGIINVRSLIKKESAEIVHTNTCHIIEGCIAARLMRVKSVSLIHERGFSPDIIRRVLAAYFRLMSDRIITVSPANQRGFFGFEGENEKYRVISGGVDLARFQGKTGEDVRAEYGFGKGTPVIGMVGRIAPWKGQDHFLRAAKAVLDEVPHARFLVVGDIDVEGNASYRESIWKLPSELGLEGKVHFTGHRDDVPELMAAMDILVHPVLEPEPFGLVIVEAMSQGKTVIAPAEGGPLSIIKDNENGMLVPPRDYHAVAEAVLTCLGDRERMEHTGEAARRHVERNFTWERTAEKIEEVYEELLDPAVDRS